ncbi:hypothetical protein JVU11DRAFT_6167 [Chiua virens]|nr:hypothetical protein JVU11DRAFT_6167 [Chiua virens]
MVTVACSLLLFSTVHFMIDIIRIVQGLILYRDTPTGPTGYFADVSQWTFIAKNYIYTVQTLIGDGVMLYRCYAVWQSKLIMILPGLLWCAVAVTGTGAPYTASHANQSEVFGGSLSQWITGFYASTFSTNLVATILLAYRIWYVDRRAAKLHGHHKSQLRPILHVIIDAGAIYSFTLMTALMCFVNQSNGQYVVLDMVTPIISITFYMVIIRVGLANLANQQTNRFSGFSLPMAWASPYQSSSTEGSRKMQVQITTSTENKVDGGRQSESRSPMSAGLGSENHRMLFRIDDTVEEVV